MSCLDEAYHLPDQAWGRGFDKTTSLRVGVTPHADVVLAGNRM